MEKLRFSEKYIEALRGSSAGFWAVAYALYKIFTPLRYMITVGEYLKKENLTIVQIIILLMLSDIVFFFRRNYAGYKIPQ